MKVYINGQGHMTKMAAMAINSKCKCISTLVRGSEKCFSIITGQIK